MFFNRVPHSGLLRYHGFLSSSFDVPRWLTLGPEGSEPSVVPIMLAGRGVNFLRRDHEIHYPTAS